MEDIEKSQEECRSVQVRELSDPASRQEWNQFVQGVDAGDILQSWEWGELKARSGWKPIRLLIQDGEKPVAGVSLLSRRVSDLLRENIPLPEALPVPDASICYAPHGPVVSFEHGTAVEAILDASTRAARRAGGFVLKVEPAVEEEIVGEQLRQRNFHRSAAAEGFGGTQPRCVMQLSLAPDLDTLLANCKQKTRYNIRLAQRKGVTVREGEGAEDLRRFYDLLLITAERDRFRVRGLEYYQDMFDILGNAGMSRLFLAEHEGELLSGAILFLFGKWCVYAYGASSNEKRQLMPNYLMQWEMIRWARENSFQIYDFRGVSPNRNPAADDHLAGLNRFKEGFNATFVEYIGDFDQVLNPVWNFAWTQGLPRLRNLFRKRRE